MNRTLQLNPMNKVATWDDIKAKRDSLETSPITITEGVFDADRDALLRIDSALSAFDVLPTLDVNNKLGWKTFDNQVVLLDKTQLQYLREEIAKRAALLHFNAGVIVSGSHLVKDLDNTELWGI